MHNHVATAMQYSPSASNVRVFLTHRFDIPPCCVNKVNLLLIRTSCTRSVCFEGKLCLRPSSCFFIQVLVNCRNFPTKISAQLILMMCTVFKRENHMPISARCRICIFDLKLIQMHQLPKENERVN